MLPLFNRLENLFSKALSRLPLSDYHKTVLWSTSLPRPRGDLKNWPYFRSIELTMRALSYGYADLVFPPADSYSMLEFGVASGSGFQLMLHYRDVWRRRLGLKKRITVVGFDTFEGMPAPGEGDAALLWNKGDLPSDLGVLERHLLRKGFHDFRLVKGLFSEALPGEIEFLRQSPPIFISLDCDFYSSTMDALSVVLPITPHGAMVYFDDVNVNFGSESTGQLKAIAAVNAGVLGPDLELVEYPLWIATREIRHFKTTYRLVNHEQAKTMPHPERRLKPIPINPKLSPPLVL